MKPKKEAPMRKPAKFAATAISSSRGAQPISNFIFEAGQLKRTARSGWLTIGIENPESVAEHTYRVCIVGLLLSRMEGLARQQEHQVLLGCLLHDVCETRVSDLNKINKKYVRPSVGAANKNLFRPLGLGVLQDFASSQKNRKAARIVLEADRLEMCFSALEYAALGHRHALDWVESARADLKTKSAKMLLWQAESADPFAWVSNASK
ncbi:HD domain-containing protein [Candidatus Parvarchaeota archaeon]|nr:HD domain-containing protein [Candidatus Parvarchaeota archaeon]